MSELKPCPFCGGKARKVTETIDPDDLDFMTFDDIDDPDCFEITCENERCINGWYLSQKDWNTRPIEDALRARIAELESISKADNERLIEAGLSVNLYSGCDTAETMAGMILQYRARIAELETAQRWIPVSERLPELYETVFVVIYDGFENNSEVARLTYLGNGNWWSWESERYVVTHWMPMPALPEVQE